MTMQILTSSEELITVDSGVEISSVKVFFFVMPSDEVTNTDDPLVVTLTYAGEYDGIVEEEVSLPFIKTIDSKHYYSAPWKNIVKISTGEEPPAGEDALWDDTEVWDDEDTWNEVVLPCVSSTAPKIFQGTESSFVVIESPFVPGPNLSTACGSITRGINGGSDGRKYPGYSYFRSGYRISYPKGYFYISSLCQTGTQVVGPFYCDNWLTRAWPRSGGTTRPDLHAISNCDHSGNWYAEFYTVSTINGFQFWTSKGSNGMSLQKAMVFVEDQTKINQEDLYSENNPTGFRARIIPWVSGTHDELLKQRWLLSSDAKLATYYAIPNWYFIGSSKYGNYADFEASTPTTLEASTPTTLCE